MADDGSLSVSPQDRDLWIRTVIGEAAGDPSAEAVAHVIANRARNSGNSVRNVVLAPGQFEPWSTRSRELMSYAENNPAYRQAANIVDDIIKGKSSDPTGGATHFYAPVAQARLGRNPPKWDDGTGQQIGAHKFFGGNPIDPLDMEWGAPPATQATKAAPSSGPDVLDMEWQAQPTKTAAAPTPAEPEEGIDFLSNAPTDKDSPAAVLAKGIGTTAIKGVSHIPGAAGDIANLADYLSARARAAYTGEPVEQVMARHNALLEGIASGSDWRAPLAQSYLAARGIIPSGPDIASKVFGVTGEYKPTSDIGRNAMLAGEIATTAGLMGAPIALPTAAGVTGNVIAEETGEPLYGLAAGLAIPSAARTMSNALANFGGNIRPNVANLADVAQTRFGIPLQPGQLSESTAIRNAHSFLNRLPLSGAGQSIAEQRGAWQRALSHTIGEDSPVLDEDTMANARTRNGGVIEDVGRRTTIQVDPQLQNDLVDTLISARRAGLADNEMRPLESVFDQVTNNIDNGQISGDAYVNMTKYRTQLWNAQHSPNPNIREWAGNLRDVLDDALERHAAPGDRMALGEARRQYRNMKILEDVIDPSGDVSPARLLTKVKQKTGNAPVYGGGGDIGDLARIGNRFLQEMPTSRTGENLTAMAALTSPLRYGAGFLGGRMIGNTLLRNPEIAQRMIDRNLGRPMQGEGLLNYLGRTVGPYAVSAPVGNALAAP